MLMIMTAASAASLGGGRACHGRSSQAHMYTLGTHLKVALVLYTSP